MSRANGVYLAFFVALVAGLWAIIAVGSRLQPPQDLAGKWKIVAGPGGSLPVPDADGMNIEQSGRFFEITFDRGPKLDLSLDSQDQPAPGQVRLQLKSAKWNASAQGPENSDDFDFTFDGPSRYTFRGHRTARTYAGGAEYAAPAPSSPGLRVEDAPPSGSGTESHAH